MKQQLRAVAEITVLSIAAPSAIGVLIGILVGLHLKPHLAPIYVQLIVVLLPLCLAGFLYGLKRRLAMQPFTISVGWAAAWLIGWLLSIPLEHLAGPSSWHWSQSLFALWQVAEVVLPALATMGGRRLRSSQLGEARGDGR